MYQTKRMDVRVMCKMAALVAIIAASAWVKFPLPLTPVPVTAQTLTVAVAALMLTPFQSFMTMGVYLALGAVGLPIFSGGAGGIQVLVGPTGGFLLGFLISAPFMSWLKGVNMGKIGLFPKYTVVALAGLPVCYVVGVAVFCLVTGQTPIKGLMGAVVPFIFGDVLKSIAAALLAARVARSRISVE